jgi:hypothetical protein
MSMELSGRNQSTYNLNPSFRLEAVIKFWQNSFKQEVKH